jgi:hypothetical protein
MKKGGVTKEELYEKVNNISHSTHCIIDERVCKHPTTYGG